MSQLLHVSVNVDESQLHAFIASAIAAVNDKFQRELQLLNKSVAVVKESLAMVTRDVHEVREKDLPQLFEYVHELRASPLLARRAKSGMRSASSFFGNTGNGGGGGAAEEGNLGGSSSPTARRGTNATNADSAATAGVNLAAAQRVESRGNSDDENDDSDRARHTNQHHDDDELDHLTQLITDLSARVDVLSKTIAENHATLDSRTDGVSQRVDTSEEHHAELLKMLGLERSATFGLIKSCALDENVYLQEADALLRQAGHRMTAIEASVKTKCAVRDLDAVVHTVSDLKGFCTAAVARLDEQRQLLRSEVEGLGDRFDKRLHSYVPWTDLDTFKVSLTDAMQRTRDATVDAVRNVARVEADVELIKENLANLTPAPSPAPPPPPQLLSSSGAVGSSVSLVKESRANRAVTAASDFSSSENAASPADRAQRYVTYAEVVPSPDLKVHVVNQGINRITSALDNRATPTVSSSRPSRPQSALGTRRM